MGAALAQQSGSDKGSERALHFLSLGRMKRFFSPVRVWHRAGAVIDFASVYQNGKSAWVLCPGFLCVVCWAKRM